MGNSNPRLRVVCSLYQTVPAFYTLSASKTTFYCDMDMIFDFDKDAVFPATGMLALMYDEPVLGIDNLPPKAEIFAMYEGRVYEPLFTHCNQLVVYVPMPANVRCSVYTPAIRLIVTTDPEPYRARLEPLGVSECMVRGVAYMKRTMMCSEAWIHANTDTYAPLHCPTRLLSEEVARISHALRAEPVALSEAISVVDVELRGDVVWGRFRNTSPFEQRVGRSTSIVFSHPKPRQASNAPTDDAETRVGPLLVSGPDAACVRQEDDGALVVVTPTQIQLDPGESKIWYVNVSLRAQHKTIVCSWGTSTKDVEIGRHVADGFLKQPLRVVLQNDAVDVKLRNGKKLPVSMILPPNHVIARLTVTDAVVLVEPKSEWMPNAAMWPRAEPSNRFARITLGNGDFLWIECTEKTNLPHISKNGDGMTVLIVSPPETPDEEGVMRGAIGSETDWAMGWLCVKYQVSATSAFEDSRVFALSMGPAVDAREASLVTTRYDGKRPLVLTFRKTGHLPRYKLSGSAAIAVMKIT